MEWIREDMVEWTRGVDQRGHIWSESERSGSDRTWLEWTREDIVVECTREDIVVEWTREDIVLEWTREDIVVEWT